MYNIFIFKYINFVSKITDFSIIDYQYGSNTIIRLNKLNNNIIISNRFSNKAFNISILDAKIKKYTTDLLEQIYYLDIYINYI